MSSNEEIAPKLPPDLFEVEKVIGHKGSGKRRMYLVSWKDCPESDNSWEPVENLVACSFALQQYHKKLEVKSVPAEESSNEGTGGQEEELYEVENIHDHRVDDISRSFMVEWKGYGLNHCTWEPESNLDHCPEILMKYLRKNNLPGTSDIAKSSPSELVTKKRIPKVRPRQVARMSTGARCVPGVNQQDKRNISVRRDPENSEEDGDGRYPKRLRGAAIEANKEEEEAEEKGGEQAEEDEDYSEGTQICQLPISGISGTLLFLNGAKFYEGLLTEQVDQGIMLQADVVDKFFPEETKTLRDRIAEQLALFKNDS